MLEIVLWYLTVKWHFTLQCYNDVIDVRRELLKINDDQDFYSIQVKFPTEFKFPREIAPRQAVGKTHCIIVTLGSLESR